MATMNPETALEVASKAIRPYIVSKLTRKTPIKERLTEMSVDEIHDVKMSIHRYADLAGYTSTVSAEFLRQDCDTLGDLADAVEDNSREE